MADYQIQTREYDENIDPIGEWQTRETILDATLKEAEQQLSDSAIYYHVAYVNHAVRLQEIEDKFNECSVCGLWCDHPYQQICSAACVSWNIYNSNIEQSELASYKLAYRHIREMLREWNDADGMTHFDWHTEEQYIPFDVYARYIGGFSNRISEDMIDRILEGFDEFADHRVVRPFHERKVLCLQNGKYVYDNIFANAV